jgi:hypothetical protein
MRWLAIVAAVAIGFGGGWIVKDVTTDDHDGPTRPCVGDREGFEAFNAVEAGREPDCIPGTR